MTVIQENRAFTARVKPGALKLAMEFHRWNYRRLENISGVSKSTISNIITGKAKTVNPETASALAEALDVPTGSLFLLEPLHDTEAGFRAA